MNLPVATETDGVEATERLGERFSALLGAGDRVLVSGELGAGKTAFVRGICRGLGVEGPVTSPTFTIARRYEDGRVPVSHLDLYRLAEGLEGEDPGLLEEEFGEDRLTLVEWPQRAPVGWLPEAHRVELHHLGGDARKVTIA